MKMRREILLCALLQRALWALQPRIFFAPRHGLHRNDESSTHPESPARLDDMVLPALSAMNGTLSWKNVMEPRTDARLAVERVHALEHVTRVERIEGVAKLGPDTYACEDSFTGLLCAQSLWLDAVDAALEEPGMPSWALARPPGHHAGYASADGFCVFNFCAAAAAYALEKLGVESVGLLDWDAHHGNGVAEYVDSEPRAVYASVHQAPLWPGTGDDDSEMGPLRNRLSAPVSRGARRLEYAESWASCIAFVGEKSPQLILVSAGFDALRSDPLAQCSLTPDDFALISRKLKEAFPDTPIVFGLEGGYSKDMGPAVAKSLSPWLPNADEEAEEESDDEQLDLVKICDVSELPEIGEMREINSSPELSSCVVCVDTAGKPHVLCDRMPPLGASTMAYGDFDPQIGCVADRATGTKFYVETGDVRGGWCPSLPRSDADESITAKQLLSVAPPVAVKEREEGIFVNRLDLESLSDSSRLLGSFGDDYKEIFQSVPTRATLDRLFRDGPVEIAVESEAGQVRAACVSSVATEDDKSRLEVGYYLVRVPNPDDPPTTATDKIIADVLHGGRLERVKRRGGVRRCAQVAAGVAVFVHPAARGRNLGEILFKQAMLACRLLGFDYMLFVERDTGSGRLVRWYEAMGFVKVPPGALPGLDRAMIGELPNPKLRPEFYDAERADDVVVRPFVTPPRPNKIGLFPNPFTSL